MTPEEIATQLVVAWLANRNHRLAAQQSAMQTRDTEIANIAGQIVHLYRAVLAGIGETA